MFKKMTIMLFLCFCWFYPVRLFSEVIIQAAAEGPASYSVQARFKTDPITLLFRIADNQIDAVGFSSRYFAVGSLFIKGILRTADNPAGYSSRSSVYCEKSGFRLDTRTKGGTLNGVVLMPFSDLFSLYVYHDSNDTIRSGGLLRLQPCREFFSEFLFAYANPDGSSDESWFHESFPFQGGGIMTGVCRMHYNRKGVVFDGQAICSGGESIAPGAAFNTVLGITHPGIRGTLLLSGITDSFRTGDGASIETALNARTTGSVLLHSNVQVTIAYEKKIPHHVLPESWFYSGAEVLSAGVETWFPLKEAGSLNLECGYSASSEEKPLVMSPDEHRVTLDATVTLFQMLSLSGGMKMCVNADGISRECILKLILQTSGFRSYLRVAVKWSSPEPTLEGLVSIAYQQHGWSVFVRAATGTPIELQEAFNTACLQDAGSLFKFEFGCTFYWE